MDHIRHFHRHHARAPVADAETIVSVVYVTASATFTGAIAGYTTLGVEATTSADSDATDTPTTSASQAKATSKATSKASTDAAVVADTSSTPTKAKTTLATSASTTPSAISSPETTAASSLAILTAASLAPTAASISSAASTASASSSSSSSTASASSSTGGGMGAGGKAGLAIGILLLLGAVLALVLFCFKRKKEQAKHQLADEKSGRDPFAGSTMQSSASVRTTRTTATAPRLSLRPVTQFLPDLGGKRKSAGNALNIATIAEKPTPATPNSSERQNPFSNSNEIVDAANAKGPAVVENVNANAEVVSPRGTAVAAVALAAPLERGQSKRGNGPLQMDFTKQGPFMGPPSPSGTEYSSASEDNPNAPAQTPQAAAIAAAGGPQNSTVHRVQLDFKPSMEDELELRAGQLVRVLHEYDDGWAMCIRLDRSQQGVAPRTCLSTRPVEPRPMNPRGPPPISMRPGQHQPNHPMAPAGRPMTPNGPQGRPMTPQGRPTTPRGRPATPQGPPGTPQGRSRSNSAAQAQQMRRSNAAGPSPMSPGQTANHAGHIMSQGDLSIPGSPAPPYPGQENERPTTQFPSGQVYQQQQSQRVPSSQSGPIGRKPVPGQAL